MNRRLIRDKYREFRSQFPEATIYYALKANPHPGIVRLLQELDCHFEISSLGELELLSEMGVRSRRIISGNPVKERAFVERAHASGIDLFAFDSYPEIDKLEECAPGSRVTVRLAVPNDGSEWPLSKKFGVEPREAADLLLRAGERGLKPVGVTFHVGSQCTRPATWAVAIEKSKLVWRMAAERGLSLSLLNVGGGFPIEYLRPVPSTAEIAAVVRRSVAEAFPEGVELAIAPGRALVGEAGVLAATVIARAERDSRPWFYLDVGVFNGLMESVGGIRYRMLTDRGGPAVRCVLAGPSCDSFDVIAMEAELPDLQVGDGVRIMSAGAYTTAYASQFDGFQIPAVHYTE
ncbi:MAG: type III PLP-dependent enzyme [Chloroflexi bacterium]|nr:type III PLP-dependent enzyme [Chloroflexota bacterium]